MTEAELEVYLEDLKRLANFPQDRPFERSLVIALGNAHRARNDYDDLAREPHLYRCAECRCFYLCRRIGPLCPINSRHKLRRLEVREDHAQGVPVVVEMNAYD